MKKQKLDVAHADVEEDDEEALPVLRQKKRKRMMQQADAENGDAMRMMMMKTRLRIQKQQKTRQGKQERMRMQQGHVLGFVSASAAFDIARLEVKGTMKRQELKETEVNLQREKARMEEEE